MEVRRHLLVLAGLTLAAWGFLLANGAVTAGDVESWEPFSGAPDIAADKYVAAAALNGRDPYLPIKDLAPGDGWDVPAPRPPAAIVLSLPLVAIPDGLLLVVMAPAMMAIPVHAAWAGHLIARARERWAWVGLATIAAAGGLQQLVVSASVTALFVPSLLAGWLFTVRNRDRLGGALLGLAAAVKLWPAVLIFAFLRRRRVAGWMIGSATVLTFAGLLIPTVTIEGTIETSRTAGALFVELPTNLSLVPMGTFGIALGLVVLAAAVWKQSVGAGVVAGLLLSPLTWVYYWICALPVLISLLSFTEDRIRRRPISLEEVDEAALGGTSNTRHG